MELDPAAVDRVARRWDAQHLELSAAGQQIRRAPAAGFSASVAATAQRFATSWGRTAADLGDSCRTRAEAMRISARLAVDADDDSDQRLTSILAAVAQHR